MTLIGSEPEADPAELEALYAKIDALHERHPRLFPAYARPEPRAPRGWL